METFNLSYDMRSCLETRRFLIVGIVINFEKLL